MVTPGVLVEEGLSYVSAPASAAVGQEVTIDIQTFGSPCYMADSTVVTPTPDGATIAVYDRWPKADCAALLVPIHHTAALNFTTPGTKNVLIHGWDSGHADVDIPIQIVVQ